MTKKTRRVIDDLALLEGSGVGIPAYADAVMGMFVEKDFVDEDKMGDIKNFLLSLRNNEVEEMGEKDETVVKDDSVDESEDSSEESKEVVEESVAVNEVKSGVDVESVVDKLLEKKVESMTEKVLKVLSEKLEAKNVGLHQEKEGSPVPKFKEFGLVKQDEWLKKWCENEKVQAFFKV